MRVCVINPNFYRSSGVTVALRTIHAATRPLGIEQTFVSCRYGDDEEDTSWVPEGGLMSFRLMDSNPGVVAKEIWELRAWLRRTRMSIVHVHHRRLAAILCSCKTLFGFPVVYTGHLTYPFAPWFWPVCPDVATAVSNSVARNMQATTRIRDVTVIGNPVIFPGESKTSTAAETEVDAVCIGRLDSVKGHKHLIRAWANLRDQNCRAKLALVGEGALNEELRAQVRHAGLNDLVEFRGFRTDVRSEILRGRFCILASSVEGQPVAVIEAAACGRASLVTDVDGSRDCLPPTRGLPNGIPFGDADAMAAALKKWLTSPEMVRQDGALFLEFLRKANSIEVVGQLYAEAYQKAAS